MVHMDSKPCMLMVVWCAQASQSQEWNGHDLLYFQVPRLLSMCTHIYCKMVSLRSGRVLLTSPIVVEVKITGDSDIMILGYNRSGFVFIRRHKVGEVQSLLDGNRRKKINVVTSKTKICILVNHL